MIKTIKSILQRSGVYVQRFQTPEAFYEYVKEESVAVQFFEIKRISKSIEQAGNHHFYNDLLKLFVPNWKVEIRFSKFIKNGFNKENINIYRKVLIDGKIAFEKVFYSNSASLKKMLLLDNVANKLRIKGIKIPRCRCLYKGKVLTIVYFDFNEENAVAKENFQEEAARISNILYFTPVNIFGEIIPEYLFNYKKHALNFSIEKEYVAYGEFEKENIFYGKIEKGIETGRWVLTHGDLKYNHLYKNGMLIDWDKFGIFPAGLEQANLFYESFMKSHHVNRHPLQWLHNYYFSMIPKEEWMWFKLNFLYFLFIFSIDVLEKPENNKMKQYILERIKDYNVVI